jgi:hypothetical protein
MLYVTGYLCTYLCTDVYVWCGKAYDLAACPANLDGLNLDNSLNSHAEVSCLRL